MHQFNQNWIFVKDIEANEVHGGKESNGVHDGNEVNESICPYFQ